jgi:hypothetical protein
LVSSIAKIIPSFSAGYRDIARPAAFVGMLDRDFPDAPCTHENVVVAIADQFQSPARELRGVGNCPKRDMGIKQ